MCINRNRIHTRTIEEAKEMAKKVSQYCDPLAKPNTTSSISPSRPPEHHFPMLNLDLVSSRPSIRHGIVPPIPRDSEGIRYGCDF